MGIDELEPREGDTCVLTFDFYITDRKTGQYVVNKPKTLGNGEDVYCNQNKLKSYWFLEKLDKGSYTATIVLYDIIAETKTTLTKEFDVK